MVGEALFLSC